MEMLKCFRQLKVRMTKKSLQGWVDNELYAKIEARAKEEQRSISNMTSKLLIEALANE